MSKGSHEDFSRHDPIQGSSDRSFGLVFTAFFLLVGLWPLWKQQEVKIWALAVSGVLLLVSLAVPRILAPANFLWTKLAVLLNKVVSPIAMGVIFFGIATPTAILMRMFGKDPLRLRKDPGETSYWIHRAPPGPAPETMQNQF